MIGSKTKSAAKGNAKANPGYGMPGDTASTCVISESTILEGKFSCDENVRLDGKINGEVHCQNRLVMGKSGKIEGTVKAAEAVIMGAIEGEVIVTGKLELKSSANIKGTIQAKLMAVEEGAVYNGECKIGNATANS